MGLNPATWFKKKPTAEGPKKVSPEYAHVPRPNFNPNANPMPDPKSQFDNSGPILSADLRKESTIEQYYREHPVHEHHEADWGNLPEEGMLVDEKVKFLKNAFKVTIIDESQDKEVGFVTGLRSLWRDFMYSRMLYRPTFWLHFAILVFVIYDFYRTTWRTLRISGWIAKHAALAFGLLGKKVGDAGKFVVDKVGAGEAVEMVKEKVVGAASAVADGASGWNWRGYWERAVATAQGLVDRVRGK